jgi:AraC-like DNA-binding protein
VASDDSETGVLRLSSGDPSDRDSTERFRENFGRAVLRIDMEPIAGERLEADLTLRSLPDLGMASGHLSPMRNRHGPDLIDNDDIVLVMIQEGFATLGQGGRMIEVGPGDVVATDNGQPATFTGHSATQVVNLRFRREQLAPHVVDLDLTLRAAAVSASEALDFLTLYARSLNREGALGTAELRQAVSRQMYDLAALAMGATKDVSEAAQEGGLRAARLHAIKGDILRNLTDSRLTSDAVAARHKISSRYLRTLFEAEGTSFSDFVISRRLQRAHRMLTDMSLASKPIRSIASDCGFRDLSHFNQMFRRRYGTTPSDARAKAQEL